MMTRTSRVTVAAAAMGLAASSLIGGVAIADDDRDDDSQGEYEEHDSYDSAEDREDDDSTDDDDDSADDDDASCTATSDATLSVTRKSPRRLAVAVEVDAAEPDQRWLLEVWQNGHRRLSSTRSTDQHGHATADRSVRDSRGKDHVELLATSESGETCTADVTGFKRAAKAPKKSRGTAPGTHTSKPS